MPSMKKSKSGSLHGGSRAETPSKAKALRQYVDAALSSRAKDPQSLTYNSFVKELQALRRKVEHDEADAAAEFGFVSLVRALRDCVCFLQRGAHETALSAALGVCMWSCSAAVREAVLELAVEVATCSTCFSSNGVQVLAYSLLPPPGSGVLQPDVPGTPWEPPQLAVDVQDGIIRALEQVVAVMPALPGSLLDMLLSSVPHKLRDRQSQCLFLRAALALAESRAGATMREGVLGGLVEHLLSIDADIRWQDIVDAPTGCDQEEASDGEDLFDLEGLIDLEIDPAAHADQLEQLHDGFHDPAAFAAASHHALRQQQQQQQQQQHGGAADADANTAKPPAVDVTADKLDSMMELVLGHLQRRVAAGQLPHAWDTMLRAFERRLLHAHRCKFTQFLVFFLAVQEPALCCPSFATALLAGLRNAAQPPITRCACASYLASFLARCAPAPKALVADVLRKLAAAACEYADDAMAAARRHQEAAQQAARQGFHRVGSSASALALCLGGAGVGGGPGLGAASSNAALVLLAGLDELMGQGPLNNVAVTHAAASNGGASAAFAGGAGGSAGALAAIQRHQVFYAMVQALLYLLCYHMQPVFSAADAAPEGSEQRQLGDAVRALVVDQVLPLLSHPLAPLAVCHQAVTAEFVRQAQLLGLADAAWEAAALETVSQHQAALALAASATTPVVVGGDSGGGGGGDGGPGARVLRPLEAFFPFDPYLLRRSARFLELPRTYTCFSHGHPHTARGGGGAGGAGGEAGAGDDSDGSGDDDTTSDDEGDEWDEEAAAMGASDGSSSSGSDTSSSSSDEDDDAGNDGGAHHHPSVAAAAAASGAGRLKRRAASLLPVGLAAAANGAGSGLSGPSPPPDLMATSLLASSGGGGPGLPAFLVGASFDSGGGLFQAGGSPYLGSSPMPMSITPYEPSHMLNLQQQLAAAKQQREAAAAAAAAGVGGGA